MYAFEYVRPGSLDEAVKLLGEQEEAKLIAGGQSFLPTLKLRLAQPETVVDLGALAGELKGIRRDGDNIVIGAMTTHAEVAASAEVTSAIPGLAYLASLIGDPQVRHRGTLGGSIANADPGADYPAAVVGLNATVHTTRRTIAADDFFTGMFETALEDDEIIRAVSFPIAEKSGYAKFRNPASRYALVSVMVARTGGGVRVAVSGAGPSVFRVPEMEQALSSNFSPEAVAGIKVSPNDLNSDLYGTPEYRAHLVTVMARRAIVAAG